MDSLVAQAGLKLKGDPPASASRAGIIGLCHHAQPLLYYGDNDQRAVVGLLGTLLYRRAHRVSRKPQDPVSALGADKPLRLRRRLGGPVLSAEPRAQDAPLMTPMTAAV